MGTRGPESNPQCKIVSCGSAHLWSWGNRGKKATARACCPSRLTTSVSSRLREALFQHVVGRAGSWGEPASAPPRHVCAHAPPAPQGFEGSWFWALAFLKIQYLFNCLFLMYMAVFPACVCIPCMLGQKKSTDPWHWNYRCQVLLCGCWGLNPGLLKEQPVLYCWAFTLVLIISIRKLLFLNRFSDFVCECVFLCVCIHALEHMWRSGNYSV